MASVRPADLPHIHYNEGLALAKAGELDSARDTLLAALVLAPGLVDTHVVLGKVYAQAGDLPRAIASWERAIALQAGHPGATAALSKGRELHAAALRRRSRMRVFQGMAALALVAIGFGVRASASSLSAWAASHIPTAHLDSAHISTNAASIGALLREVGDSSLSTLQVSADSGVVHVSGVVPTARDSARIGRIVVALSALQPMAIDGIHVRGDSLYIIRAGETLWSIAHRFYNDGARWESIAKANPSLAPPFRSLRIGMTILIPALGR